MKKLKLAMFLFMIVVCAKAQIGYQVSLLNTATGEPRANESVTVSVSLSDSEGKVFYSETKSATTNDFGVLSLSVGNADTFKEVDLTKMPFFIEATANGVMIGKSQILSVPVAEVAKEVAPAISKEELCKKTWTFEKGNYTFHMDGTGGAGENSFRYEILGHLVVAYGFYEHSNKFWTKLFVYVNGDLHKVD